jgi:hypothetical protein
MPMQSRPVAFVAKGTRTRFIVPNISIREAMANWLKGRQCAARILIFATKRIEQVDNFRARGRIFH